MDWRQPLVRWWVPSYIRGKTHVLFQSGELLTMTHSTSITRSPAGSSPIHLPVSFPTSNFVQGGYLILITTYLDTFSLWFGTIHNQEGLKINLNRCCGSYRVSQKLLTTMLFFIQPKFSKLIFDIMYKINPRKR